jgi:hypothetical protein
MLGERSLHCLTYQQVYYYSLYKNNHKYSSTVQMQFSADRKRISELENADVPKGLNYVKI